MGTRWFPTSPVSLAKLVLKIKRALRVLPPPYQVLPGIPGTMITTAIDYQVIYYIRKSVHRKTERWWRWCGGGTSYCCTCAESI